MIPTGAKHRNDQWKSAWRSTCWSLYFANFLSQLIHTFAITCHDLTFADKLGWTVVQKSYVFRHVQHYGREQTEIARSRCALGSPGYRTHPILMWQLIWRDWLSANRLSVLLSSDYIEWSITRRYFDNGLETWRIWRLICAKRRERARKGTGGGRARAICRNFLSLSACQMCCC